MSMPTYRLFILGAGFSQAAGLPLGPELLASVRAHTRDVFRGAGWDGPLEKEIQEWRELYPGKRLDLELVLAYSHRKHHLKLIGSEEYFAHASRAIEQVRRSVQAVLIDAMPLEAPALYKSFARRLRPHDLVLTFNYDTLLEQALEEIGKPFTLTPEWWLDESASSDSGADDNARYVEVLKLHGSVDWYDRYYYDSSRRYYADRCADVPYRDPLFSPSARIQCESLARGPVRHEWGQALLNRVFRVPRHRDHFPFHGANTEAVPFLLPPAHDKLLGQETIVELWENLHRTGDVYSAIIMMGYSMPAYDSYAYEAIGRLIIQYQRGGGTTRWGQRRVPFQIVTLANSREEAIRTVPFFSPTKTRAWADGLSDDALDWLDWGD